jgi:molybdopterin molybdotransferase
MISVAQAQNDVVRGLGVLDPEYVSLATACGRVLASDLLAGVTQPPSDVSAMDGYAVRSGDVLSLPCSLKQVGAVAAGSRFPGTMGPGETVRIFTGAPLPDGADAIVIQENVRVEGDTIHVVQGDLPSAGRHVRRSGTDFRRGDILLQKGRRLTSRDVALVAAMNHAGVQCVRRPRVALLATGDELLAPGSTPEPSRIICSSPVGLAADVAQWGGASRDLGIARDTISDIREKARGSIDCDIFVTLGGASVGDHDLIQKALTPELVVSFWKIAMRPGKPLISGRHDGVPFLGLPGNPVSALVCARLFLKPMIWALLGATGSPWRFLDACLASPLPENDARQDYVRCQLQQSRDDELVAAPFPVQDSSQIQTFSKADGLIVRKPHDPQKKAGDRVRVLLLDD